jgi:hypothetical protein
MQNPLPNRRVTLQLDSLLLFNGVRLRAQK